MSRLSDATRRLLGRELVIKKATGEVIPADFADRLREPATGEAEALAALVKSDASDEEIDAVAGALRLLDSAGVDFDVAKDGGGIPPSSKPTTPEPIADDDIPPWFLVEIERERHKDPSLRNVSDEELMRRLIAANPEWADDGAPDARDSWDAWSRRMKLKKEKPRTPEERERIAKEARDFNEAVQRNLRKAERERAEREQRANETLDEKVRRLDAVTKSIEILDDKRALERIDEAAARLRKAYPSLSKPQAVAKAMENDPELYKSYARDHARKQGWLDDDPQTVKKAEDAYAILEEAAKPYRQADPSLTREQAIAKALENDSSLYTRTAP